MSRKITQESVEAFMSATPFTKSNMSVEVKPNVTILSLFGNETAYRYNDPQKTLSITNCGWKSNTTKDRLNALPNVNICQRAGVWFLNGEQWSGELTDIEPVVN